MTPAFASSHFCLALVMGAGGTLGLLHLSLWLLGRMERSHFWVAAFCAASVVFQAGRYLEVQANIPVDAIYAGRMQVGAVPIMVFALIGFTRSLQLDSWRPSHYLSCLFVTTLLSASGFFSDFMIADKTFEMEDWFGHRHITPDGAPGIILLGLYVIPAFIYLVTEVRRSPRISLLEKRVVITSAAIFTLLGVLTILSALNWLDIPATAHFGPLVISCGMSFLLVHQHVRMRGELEVMADQRARLLRETNTRYRQLVDNAPVGILALDAEGELRALNPRMREMLGLAATEFNGDGSADVSILNLPAVVESGMAASLRGCLSTARPVTDEFELLLPDDQRTSLRMDIIATRDAGGLIKGVQAIVEDVGARRHLEEQLRQSQKMEAIGGLAAGIAHEINNPMSYVRANLKMLREEWELLLTESATLPASLLERMSDCEEMLEDSLEGVERTVTLVREVNEFSHGQGDNKVEIDLNELLEESLRVAEQQLDERICVARNMAALPRVQGSPGQIRQVFLNLIINAIHAIGENGTLEVESEYLEDQGEVVARIIDDGDGIPQDAIDRVFDPFFTTKAAGKGTGLGLYICYEIIRMHQGSILVRSTEGVGTRFEVHLPLKPAVS